MSQTQRRCIIAATIAPLICFRRGFAATKAGPFYRLDTVQALIESGALRAIYPQRGKRALQLSARAS
jgi:hypothetical protein